VRCGSFLEETLVAVEFYELDPAAGLGEGAEVGDGLLEGEVATEAEDLALVDEIEGLFPLSGPWLCNGLFLELNPVGSRLGKQVFDQISANVRLLISNRTSLLAKILQPDT
jgi:hypothetical protein